MKLVHMDIKPDNIFICRRKIWKSQERVDFKADGDVPEECSFEEEVVYKIGDLGHVTSIIDTKDLEDEGDCR
jgi:wee1-like protein kinase